MTPLLPCPRCGQEPVQIMTWTGVTIACKPCDVTCFRFWTSRDRALTTQALCRSEWNANARKTLPFAILFVGAEGQGKTTLARDTDGSWSTRFADLYYSPPWAWPVPAQQYLAHDLLGTQAVAAAQSKVRNVVTVIETMGDYHMTDKDRHVIAQVKEVTEFYRAARELRGLDHRVTIAFKTDPVNGPTTGT